MITKRKLFKALHVLVFSAFANQGFATEIQPSLSNLRLSFVENKGQIISSEVENEALYYVDGKNVDCFLKKKGLSYVWQVRQGENNVKSYQMDLEFVNANPNSKIHSEEMDQGVSNFYLAHCPKGITNVHSYNKVVYENIYDKIDLVFYVADGSDKANATPIKYDFVVKPGGDPKQIKINYKGSKDLQIDNNGELTAFSTLGELREGKPFTYQHMNADKSEIQSSYRIENKNTLSFNVSDYDVTKELIIDPSIQWGTYYGGNSNEFEGHVTYDASGNVYLAGSTYSPSLATLGQTSVLGFSGIIVKFNPAGTTRLWSTYFGENFTLNDICMDKASTTAFFIAGTEKKAVDPRSSAVCAKFSTAGAFLASNTHQGNNNYEGVSVASTSIGTVYLGGKGMHHDAAVDQDFFARYVNFVWAAPTYVAVMGIGASVTTDGQNNLYVAGGVPTANNPAGTVSTVGSHQYTPAGDKEGYLLKYNSAGVKQWGTFYGGTLYDEAKDVIADASGNVFIVGIAVSTTGISTAGTHQTALKGNSDAFLAKFNTSGVRQWGTYYGGTASTSIVTYKEEATAVGLCSDGKIIVTGTAKSSDFIATNYGGEDVTFAGGTLDGFVAKFETNGQMNWSSYLGGAGLDYPLSVAVNSANEFFVSGNTASGSDIALSGYDNIKASGTDLFLRKYNNPTPTIVIDYFNPSEISCGYNIYVHFTTTGTFNVGNIFKAELYDNLSTLIGTYNGSSTPVPIAFLFPVLDPTKIYSIRVISTLPSITSPLTPVYYRKDGINFANPFYVNFTGLLDCDNPYSLTLTNTDCYRNDYGTASNDIYYQFTLDNPQVVDISTCNSSLATTYVYLLNSSGGLLASGLGAGPLCAGTKGSIRSATLPAGTYNVVVEGAGSTMGSITLDLSIFGCSPLPGAATSVVSLSNEASLSVYPNPFNNATNIIVNGVKDKAVIEIVHVNGSVVYKNENYVTNETITLGENLLSGFYMLRVTTSTGSKSLKLVKTE